MGYKYCKEGHILDRSWKYCPVCLAPLRGWLVAIHEDQFVKFYTIHEGKSFVEAELIVKSVFWMPV